MRLPKLRDLRVKWYRGRDLNPQKTGPEPAASAMLRHPDSIEPGERGASPETGAQLGGDGLDGLPSALRHLATPRKLAEEVGFEPTEHMPYGFRDRCHKPCSATPPMMAEGRGFEPLGLHALTVSTRLP